MGWGNPLTVQDQTGRHLGSLFGPVDSTHWVFDLVRLHGRNRFNVCGEVIQILHIVWRCVESGCADSTHRVAMCRIGVWSAKGV